MIFIIVVIIVVVSSYLHPAPGAQASKLSRAFRGANANIKLPCITPLCVFVQNGSTALVNRAPYLALAASGAINNRSPVASQFAAYETLSHIYNPFVIINNVLNPLDDTGPVRFSQLDETLMSSR